MQRELHVVSPLMRGPDVLEVQQRLLAAGFEPGPLDAAYGPTTEAAVRAFQATRTLTVDGAVGEQTRTALLAVDVAAGGSVPGRSASAIGTLALLEAVKHLGVRENPPGSNGTLFGVWYGCDGVPWCNIFVSYCFHVGAHYTICDGFHGAGTKAGKGCAYVPTTAAWLRATGMWVGRTEPKPGDIAIFNWDGGAPDHIGMVEKNLGNGQFVSIEGNTAIGNESNGGEVMRRQRHIVQVDGFGRVTGPI
jgi:Putative peptidoglycan binding domain/CHAP domain